MEGLCGYSKRYHICWEFLLKAPGGDRRRGITYPYGIAFVHMFAHHIAADERWPQHDINSGKSSSASSGVVAGVPASLVRL